MTEPLPVDDESPDFEHLPRAGALDRITVLVIRDPDGPDDIRVYCDDEPAEEPRTISVDAGAGWTGADWEQARLDALAGTTGSLRTAIAAAFAQPPGEEHIN